jgi:DNA processing protein
MEDLSGMTEKQAARLHDPTFLPQQAQWDYLEKAKVRLLTLSDADYPRNLRDITDPPPVLFVRGTLLEQDRFAVALVGSRQASPYGRSVTARMAHDLATAGLTVVSGGAIGVDTAAHRAVAERPRLPGSLPSMSGGRTLVVLGCGLDIDYPRTNQPLFERIIAECGAVLTEFPLGATPEPWRFPMRNRIISGLAMGVVVVEAGTQSGALLTANIAVEQGRDVMAVPGPVDRESCRGTNGLLKDGAILVENAEDVMRALGVLRLEAPVAQNTRKSVSPSPATPSFQHLPDAQRRLLENLSLTPKHIDALSADVRLPPVDVSVQMTMLELSGLVRRLPGNCYIRVL